MENVLQLDPLDPKFQQIIVAVENYSHYQVQKSLEHFVKEHASSPPRKEKKKKSKKRKRSPPAVDEDVPPNPTNGPDVTQNEDEPPAKVRKEGDSDLSKRTLLNGMRTGTVKSHLMLNLKHSRSGAIISYH